MTTITLTREADGFRHTLTLFTTVEPGVVDGGLMAWSQSRLRASTPVRLTLDELAAKVEAEGWRVDADALARFCEASRQGMEHDPFEGVSLGGMA